MAEAALAMRDVMSREEEPSFFNTHLYKAQVSQDFPNPIVIYVRLLL